MIAAVKNALLFTQLRNGNPNLRETREFYLFRQDANDFPREAIDHNLLPEHFLRISEAVRQTVSPMRTTGALPAVSSASAKSRPMIGFILSTAR